MHMLRKFQFWAYLCYNSCNNSLIMQSKLSKNTYLAAPYHLTDSCKVLEVTELQFLRKSGRSPHTWLFLCFFHKCDINYRIISCQKILHHENYSISLPSLLRCFVTPPIVFYEEFNLILSCKKVIFYIFHVFCLFFLRQDPKTFF